MCDADQLVPDSNHFLFSFYNNNYSNVPTKDHLGRLWSKWYLLYLQQAAGGMQICICDNRDPGNSSLCPSVVMTTQAWVWLLTPSCVRGHSPLLTDYSVLKRPGDGSSCSSYLSWCRRTFNWYTQAWTHFTHFKIPSLATCRVQNRFQKVAICFKGLNLAL